MKLIFILLIFIPFNIAAPVVKDKTIYIVRPEPIKNYGFDFQAFRELIYKECKFPDIVLKQAILESANFESRFWKDRYNCFGFQIYKGWLKDYQVLHFKSPEECVKYYSAWQKRKYKHGNYYEFLKRIGYARDKQYITKLKQIKI